MAADEDQAESIVLNLLLIERHFVDARLDVVSKISLCCVEARAPAHPVDGLEACR
jgi:hypothetical protein